MRGTPHPRCRPSVPSGSSFLFYQANFAGGHFVIFSNMKDSFCLSVLDPCFLLLRTWQDVSIYRVIASFFVVFLSARAPLPSSNASLVDLAFVGSLTRRPPPVAYISEIFQEKRILCRPPPPFPSFHILFSSPLFFFFSTISSGLYSPFALRRQQFVGSPAFKT